MYEHESTTEGGMCSGEGEGRMRRERGSEGRYTFFEVRIVRPVIGNECGSVGVVEKKKKRKMPLTLEEEKYIPLW